MADENTFPVDTRPTKQVVVGSLTRDATVEAAIFDLIDNSVDAARDTMLMTAPDDDKHVMPGSYEGFSVALTFSGTKLVVSDNCGGISRNDLSTMALRFGERSEHELGIGVFGVGLNRALFKLGALTILRTDTGAERSELTLDVPAYLNAKDDWNLIAKEVPSTGKPGTEIEISGLPPSVSRDFADADWLQRIREEVAVRYGQFIAKGLVIKINSVPVVAHITEIRQNSPFPGEYKIFKAGGRGVGPPRIWSTQGSSFQ